MNPRTPRAAAFLAVLLVSGLLLAAGPASALYVMTPLRIHTIATGVEPGDTVDFRVEPENESMLAAWAGRTVTVRYAYDANEGVEGAEPDPRAGVVLAELALDDKAEGTFRWTVPAEADDRNLVIRVESAEGELLASRDLAVGDAPLIMRTLASEEGGGLAAEDSAGTPPAQDGVAPDTDAADTQADDAERAPVPGLGLLVGVGILAATALVVARRR